MSTPLHIEETREWMLVWNISQLPEVEDRVTDDQWSKLTTIQRKYHVMKSVEDKRNHALLVLRDRDCLGCFLLIWTQEKDRPPFHMIHTLMTRQCRGRDAIEAAKLALRFAFGLDDVQILESWCPACNPESYLFARICGFRKIGLAPVDWMKGMRAFPMHHVQMTKEQYLSLNQKVLCH